MVVINTNITSMQISNIARQSELNADTSIRRLSSGLQINNAADDPSGIAITAGMSAHLHGINIAMANVQDTISLVRTASSATSTIIENVTSIRNLALRLMNQATLSLNPNSTGALPHTTSDSVRIHDEIIRLRGNINSLAAAADFNGKGGTLGILGGVYQPGQAAQVGADNSSDNALSISLPDILSGLLSSVPSDIISAQIDPPPTATSEAWVTWAGDLVSKCDELLPTSGAGDFGLPTLYTAQAQLGALDNRLNSILDDLNIEYVNLSAAQSRISDADMAAEISNWTKYGVTQQTANAAASYAGNSAKLTIQLLDVISR